MPEIDLNKLKLHELEELLMDVEEKIQSVKSKMWKEKKHTKEEILAMFHRWGYTTPKGAKIWKIHSIDQEKIGGYGMEVGQYEHSCHIDTTDFKVLVVVSEEKDYDVQSFNDLWLSDSIIV